MATLVDFLSEEGVAIEIEITESGEVINKEVTVRLKPVGDPSPSPALPTPQIFYPPVGLDIFRADPKIWPGHWVDATGYCQHYAYGWHTGADLNLNHPTFDADKRAPVYSIADGTVYAVRKNVSGWDTVVCIKHSNCLSRYAHLEPDSIVVKENQQIEAGEFIGKIGDAGGRYSYHLHFDIARIGARMEKYPLDWPGKGSAAKRRVELEYLDPASFLYAMTA